MIAAARGLARILKSEGIDWVSTFPVCHVNNVLGSEGVRLVMMRDERFAVALADATSRVSNGQRIGVCTVMGGINAAGLQMAYGALAQAYEDSSPLLILSDGLAAGQREITRYDLDTGMQAVTKWIGHIERPEDVPRVMRRAFTLLRSGRPGPVLVTMPRGLGEYNEDTDPYLPVKGWRSAPDPEDLGLALAALAQAERPLIWAGEGVLYAQATAELLALAERAQAPVLTTLKGKSAFPEDHPLSVGVRGELAGEMLRGCDMLLAVGTSLSRGHFRHAIPDAPTKTIVQCTNDASDLNRVWGADQALIGDAKLTLAAMVDAYPPLDGEQRALRQAWLAQAELGRTQMRNKYGPLLASHDTPINPYRVYGDLMMALDRQRSFVTHDSGNTRDQSSTVYQTLIPRGYLGWGNVSTLGFGLAAAMGAKLTHPDWQCVYLTGDAGLGYILGNMEALVREEIPVTTIHINNGGFAGYGPGFWGEGHDPYTCELSEHSVADYSKAMSALGYYAEDVVKPADVLPAMERALAANAAGQPAFLEILCAQYPVFGAWVS